MRLGLSRPHNNCISPKEKKMVINSCIIFLFLYFIGKDSEATCPACCDFWAPVYGNFGDGGLSSLLSVFMTDSI